MSHELCHIKDILKKQQLEEENHILYCREMEYMQYLPPPCHCIECYVYMGEMNPRQYCGKTHCYESVHGFEDFMKETRVISLQQSPYYEKKDYKDIIQKYIDSNTKK